MTVGVGVDNNGKMAKYLRDKRDELIWALSLQDYTYPQIAKIFNIEHISTVLRIVKRRPARWKPKWVKASGK